MHNFIRVRQGTCRVIQLAQKTKPPLARLESLLGVPSAGDVEARTDITRECAVRTAKGNAMVEHPSILAVMAQEPVIHLEGLAPVKGAVVGIDTPLQVFGMHAFDPPIAIFLVKR